MGSAVREIATQPTDRHVGRRIRMRRQTLHLSEQALAAAVGVTLQEIEEYETGTKRIRAGRLQQIAGALGCPVSWFFE
jgi:transcriptional regulator with XRE-family HTH domain